jgi:hypothetical protein
MASGLLPRLQALAAPDKDMTSVIRIQSEKLVKYLGKMIVVRKDGLITRGRFRGAFLVPYHETHSYTLRISGAEEREILVTMPSLADGSTIVSLEDKKTPVE